MSINSDRKLRPKVLLVNRAVVVDNNKHILIIRRSSKDSFMPEKWELPGGKLDAGQDISNALEREVFEETGLVVLPTDKIAYWHSEIIKDGKYKGLPYVILVGITKIVGGTLRLSSEHSQHKWLSINKAFEYDLTPETKTALAVLESKI